MSTDISPENKQFIQHELESGNYHDRGELLNDALQLLKRRRDLVREIQAGINSGRSIPGDEVFGELEEIVHRRTSAGSE